MSGINPEDSITPAEIEILDQLEAIVQPCLGAYVDVGDALAEIRDRHLYRDSHPSFEAYVRERWGVDVPNALDHDDRAAIDIRLAVRKQGDAGASADGQNWDPWEVADAIGEELLPTLRWLLTQASGTIGRVAHQLEHRAAEIDDSAREQLRDDVMVVDDELATLEALLLPLTDWDSELERLLNGELPPFAADKDPQDDD